MKDGREVDDGQEGDSGEQTAHAEEQGRSVAEWTTLALSVAIVALLVGVLTYEHITRGASPPIIVVQPRLEQVRAQAAAYYLPILVTNRGDRLAQDVQVQLFLNTGGGTAEFASFRIDFLAGGDTSRMVVAFTEDPLRGVLTNVVGYRQP